MKKIKLFWGLIEINIDNVPHKRLLHAAKMRGNLWHTINVYLGEHFFPNINVGDYVYVQCLDMKKPKKVKIIDAGDNGDLKNCLFFKYGKGIYYLSRSNFVRMAK